MRKSIPVAVIGLILIAAGCAPPASGPGEGEADAAKPAPASKVAKSSMPSGPVVLEAESFALTGCEAKALAGAGGGKAVHFAKETGSAKGPVHLAIGLAQYARRWPPTMPSRCCWCAWATTR